MFAKKTINKFQKLPTPFYYYDIDLLQKTLDVLKASTSKKYHIHYALKANANLTLLQHILKSGLGADCVSGNEVKRAIETGFSPNQIVFAGVGKNDDEINYSLQQNIFCFNVESIAELTVINDLAKQQNKNARVALRVNPNVDAHTHKYITTGLEENKFGINPHEFEAILDLLKTLTHIELIGLHFHIGSQIVSLTPFKNLCLRVNEINNWFVKKGYLLPHINLGGGLGVSYQEPDKEAIVDFKSYFELFSNFLELKPNQQVHFELGRSVIAQCGSLISRVLYIKNGININFAILDAGMTELMRPALYQAYHKIENLSNASPPNMKYDVVGPICESSDCFGKFVSLPETKRNDLIAIRSAGAYGEAMSNSYNLRNLVKSVFSD